MRILNKLSLASAMVLAVAVVGTPVWVVAAPNSYANAQATQTTTDPASRGGTKLADAKLKACQNREKAINNILGRIANRGQKQLDLFTSISTKTQTFYVEKGKTLSNYDALVADVTAKKTAAQTAVDTIKANSVTFKCDGTDPKGAVASFKEALKSEGAALKDYKTSVKKLIVGVKSVQGSTTSTDNKTTGGNQ